MGLSAISLFAGAGGLDLAARRAGIRTVCYVENNPYCQGAIMSRIMAGELHESPIWDDVTSFDGNPWRGKVDIVFGGFPCQPHSVAGKRGGATDERNLWPDTLRILRECGAWGFVGENVPGIVSNGYAATVLAELEEAGFCGTPFSNSSCAVGAPQPRQRVFFLAHAIGLRRWRWHTLERREGDVGGEQTPSERRNQGVVCALGGSEARDFGGERKARREGEPTSNRVVDRLAFGMERLRSIGNGVDPYAALPAFQKIIQLAGI